ncbi:MAG TPA: hypothetical protein VGF21_16400 [Thermoleophilaceae bacterium]
MSQLTHPRLQVGLSSRFKTWLAVGAATAVAAVPAAILISNDDNSTSSPASAAAATGLRYDGGPNEGTRGISATPAGLRYDGGPEEGAADVVSQPQAQTAGHQSSDTFGRRP